MGLFGNMAEKADLRVGNMCLDFMTKHVPEMTPRLAKVECLMSDSQGNRYTHWAIAITNREGKEYFFHRCKNVWQLQMRPDEIWIRNIKPVTISNVTIDCQDLISIALNNAEDQFRSF
jgi:hypothetical protein